MILTTNLILRLKLINQSTQSEYLNSKVYSLFSSSHSSNQFDEDNIVLRQNKDDDSIRKSSSLNKKVTRKQTSTDANTRPKVSTERKSIRNSPFQSKINIIRDNTKGAEFYKKVNFKPESYGINLY